MGEVWESRMGRGAEGPHSSVQPLHIGWYRQRELDLPRLIPVRAKQFTTKAVKQRSSGSSTRAQLGKVWSNTAELVLLWAEGRLLCVNYSIHPSQHT